jgi:hypothetical protein
MYPVFALISRLLSRRNSGLGHAAVPRQLLESADGRAGSNPRQASELRLAARAYMRVVR